MATQQSKGQKRPKDRLEGKGVTLDVKDLKEAFGERLDIACLRPEIIKGQPGATIMIPANEPCPVNPHNHDGITDADLYQRVLVIKF